MPTFEQIEVLQSLCYIHKKTGYIISDFEIFYPGCSECVIRVVFHKENVDEKPKTILVYASGSYIEDNYG
ncbi:hypothetical protein HC766_02200 [Candidatus Gracilibacteria bacterium]|nr:hypothetical protein [Thermales bacterium]NJS41171.1 hypothetical protein [Candidatus Gracilibacteria bacterium]